jgi:hypothetical protein
MDLVWLLLLIAMMETFAQLTLAIPEMRPTLATTLYSHAATILRKAFCSSVAISYVLISVPTLAHPFLVK